MPWKPIPRPRVPRTGGTEGYHLQGKVQTISLPCRGPSSLSPRILHSGLTEVPEISTAVFLLTVPPSSPHLRLLPLHTCLATSSSSPGNVIDPTAHSGHLGIFLFVNTWTDPTSPNDWSSFKYKEEVSVSSVPPVPSTGTGPELHFWLHVWKSFTSADIRQLPQPAGAEPGTEDTRSPGYHPGRNSHVNGSLQC